MRTLLHRVRQALPDAATPSMPMHPERVPGLDTALRWILPAETLPSVGTVVDAPGLLGLLLRNPELTDLTAEAGGGSLLMRFRTPEALRELGPLARRALEQALPHTKNWQIAQLSDAQGETRDQLIWAAARAVLAGSLGAYVSSHGGVIHIESVTEGVLVLRFRGACRGCPLSRVSLRGRVEREVRMRCPELLGVRIR